MYVGPKIVEDGLVLALDAGTKISYPGSGTTWYDLSGNSNNCTLTNGPTFSNGSLVFDGVNDYIELGDKLDMGTGNLTIESVFIRTTNSSNSQWIMSKSYAGGGASRYWVDNNWDGVNSVYKLRFGASWSNSGHTNYLGNQTLNLNQLYHICVVVDRSDKVFLYIDGELDASYDISTYSGYNSDSTFPYRIGSYTSSNQVSPALPLNGNIKVYRHYNVALSSSEIQKNYNATKNRFGL